MKGIFILSNKWDIRYMQLAEQISTWSKDPTSKIGAVAVGDKGQVLAQGYNGFPRSIKDDERYNNRTIKYKYIVHSEMNAIFNAAVPLFTAKHSSALVYFLNLFSNILTFPTPAPEAQNLLRNVSKTAFSSASSI